MVRPQSVTPSRHKGRSGFRLPRMGRKYDQGLQHSRIAPGARALLRARAARRRHCTWRLGWCRCVGPGRGRRRRFRRLYGRAFDFAVVGTGRLAVVASPPAGFKGQRARRQGGSRGRHTGFRRSSRTERPRRQLSGAEPAAFRQQAATRPDPRLSARAAGSCSSHLPGAAPTVAAAPPSRCRRPRPRPWLTRCRAARAASNFAVRRSRCGRHD